MPEKKFSLWKFVVALAFVGGLFIALWVRKPVDEMQVIQGPTMGTTFYVRYFAGPDSPERSEVAENVKMILEQMNDEMSTYIPTSDISRVNQAQVNEWVEIPKNFAIVLDFSLRLAEMTEGFFDPTLGPLVNLWGFGPDGERVVPAKEKIERTLQAVGHDRVIDFDFENKRVRRLHPDAYIDLSATAKGHAVDVLSDYLLSVGIVDHLVEIGGDLRTRGDKRGDSWQIAIEMPRPDGGIGHRVIKVDNLAPVSSGSYRNFFEQDGTLFSHTIDFRTGRPIEHSLISVTVVDENLSMVADGWATAFMAMGAQKAQELADEHGIMAFFISFDGDITEVGEELGLSEASGQASVDRVEVEVNEHSSSAFKQMFGF